MLHLKFNVNEKILNEENLIYNFKLSVRTVVISFYLGSGSKSGSGMIIPYPEPRRQNSKFFSFEGQKTDPQADYLSGPAHKIIAGFVN